MTRRLVQITVVALVVASAFPMQGRALRLAEVRVAGVALFVLAVGLVLRPAIYGIRGQRRDDGRRRDWPFS